jgi:hypothetical protein
VQKNKQVYGVNPETLVHDYLLGEYEIEKLRNGFRPPVLAGEPCAEHQGMTANQENTEQRLPDE